jgi:hypothetical protein
VPLLKVDLALFCDPLSVSPFSPNDGDCVKSIVTNFQWKLFFTLSSLPIVSVCELFVLCDLFPAVTIFSKSRIEKNHFLHNLDAFGTGGEEFPSPKRGGKGWGQLLIEEPFSKNTISFFGSGTCFARSISSDLAFRSLECCIKRCILNGESQHTISFLPHPRNFRPKSALFIRVSYSNLLLFPG